MFRVSERVAKSARVALVAALLGSLARPAAAQADGSLEVMTFNLRYAHTNPPNLWPDRRPVVRELIESSTPDVIGTQEGLYTQIADIQADLDGYSWIGLGREGGSRGEFMAVFYRTDRLAALEFDHFWLSDTPDRIGSQSWGNNYPRMVTWVRFRDRETGREFYLVNTHLDHEVQLARERSAELILERVETFDPVLPVVLVGDFNAEAGDNPVHRLLVDRGGFVDTWWAAGCAEPPFGTFHDFEGVNGAAGGARIDWILVRGAARTLDAEIVTFARDGQYPSDHFPVVARLQLGRADAHRSLPADRRCYAERSRGFPLSAASRWAAAEQASSGALVGSPRLRIAINEGWRYAAGEIEGAERPKFDDGDWERVDLPHTWNAADAFDEVAEYRRNVGWYRKRLLLDRGLDGRRIFLHFEGANQVADVWIDGFHVGRHVGGYTAFAFDITERIASGGSVVAVRVDNRHDPDIPPLQADFTFYGGIYRDVWLIATDPVHVDLLDHAGPGVYLGTPGVSSGWPRVRARGTVVNDDSVTRRVEVYHRVIDAEGREIAFLRSEVEVAPRGRASFLAESDLIENPRLWSPDDPYLYRVETSLLVEGRAVDVMASTLGFRWIEIDPDRGFFLNGRRMPLRGTNRHQDRAGLGNALSDWAHRQDVRLIKEMGFNFLRLAHYPQDPAVLEETDRLGLLVWEEIPVVNRITTSAAFAENAERMLVEMIRQHYNHPSVAIWGTMNEVLLIQPDPMPEGYRSRVVELARRLHDRARAEDPDRPTALAISLDEVDDGSGLQDVPDVLGLNLYFGWYYRELDGLGLFLDDLHARHPRRPLFVSEYGAGSDDRVHAMEPRAFDFSTEYQQRFHEAHLPQIEARDYLVGSAVWSQFDFGSKGRHDTRPDLNQKGLYTFDRRPKDVTHYYRARLLDEPVLHIATRDWPLRAGSRPGDRVQPLTVYANVPEVGLSVNGVPQGRKRVENGRARWSVELRPGWNRLMARGESEGTAMVDAMDVRYVDRSSLFARPGSDSAGSIVTPGSNVIAVNAGGHEQYVQGEETVWEADRPYTPGGWGYIGGEPARTHHRILGTEDDALFQSARVGAESYRFDVAGGRYDVRLLFVEIETDLPGERVFAARVNGAPIALDLDLAAEHGRWGAVERQARVSIQDGEGIEIGFDARNGRATISGIEIRRIDQ